jgi:hypothetical protein
MKIVSFLFLVFIPIVTSAQIITTIAGNGTATFSGDGGLATNAGIYNASYITFDSQGNLYVSQGTFHGVRKINTAGIISAFAGNGTSGYSGDGGPATSAQVNDIIGLAEDANGNIYLGDLSNNCIRKVDAVTGIITTVVGTGIAGYNGDGIPATAAQLKYPYDLLFDKRGNMYIADNGNRRVRKVDTFGIITTIAGIGIVPYGYGGDGGPADTTAIGAVGLCMDDTGNLYIADWHSRILKVDTFGIIRTYAGNGIGGSSGDGGSALAAGMTPFKIAMDVHNTLYFSEYLGSASPNKVRKVSTTGIVSRVAGTGVAGFSGDNGLATAAELYAPRGLAIDTCGNLFIADAWNNRIRKVLFYPDCPDTTGGGDTTVYSNTPLPKGSLSIFPNPVLEELHINGVAESATYSIADIAGKQLQYGTLKMGNNSVLLVNFSPGIYLVTITEADGRVMVNKIHKE